MSSSKWACFNCRITFPREHRQCPRCDGRLSAMGKYFKPPARSKKKEWQAFQMLCEAGYHFGRRFSVLPDRAFIEAYRAKGHLYTVEERIKFLKQARDYLWYAYLKFLPNPCPTHPRDVTQFLATVQQDQQQLPYDILQVCHNLDDDHPDVQQARHTLEIIALEQRVFATRERVHQYVSSFVHEHDLGYISTGIRENDFKVGHERYVPDIALLNKEQVSQLELNYLTLSYYPFPPVLAIECVIPLENREPRINNYLKAGTVVWIVSAETQQVTIYVSGQPPETFEIDDVLHGGDVLPGFDLPIRLIFPLK